MTYKSAQLCSNLIIQKPLPHATPGFRAEALDGSFFYKPGDVVSLPGYVILLPSIGFRNRPGAFTTGRCIISHWHKTSSKSR